ncbi:MAG: hypothetical protein R3330_01660, partial [Saprospiraceae bacterium]|nr:hypothetical protein [Saprospiraceae bacterium]
GIDTLDSGRPVDVIKAEYDPGTQDNHSTSDVWWYFFDRDGGSHLASMVYHPPTYALIENTTMTDAHPIRFNVYRRSYRCDSTRVKQFLRGEFYYSDFRVPASSGQRSRQTPTK